MAYNYQASETFWRKFYDLPEQKKISTRRAWEIFKEDPFDPRLNTHRINALSARSRHTIMSARIESDLRVIFYIDGNVVYTIDIGLHAIYQ